MGAPAVSRSLLFHPLAMNSHRHWRQLYRESGGIDPSHAMRAHLINLLSILWAPLRRAEDLCYSTALERTEITTPPLFVLGHWRTGTTHLHNLLCQDPATCYVNTFQTLLPDSFLVGRHTVQSLIARSMPKKRHMDNVSLGADLPQEEEMAMANISPHSFYVGLYFPNRMPELFTRYVLFEGLTPREHAEWKQAYLSLLKKVAYVNPGKRLVLKSPTNTGRIPQLLELFPDAKFIYLHRDPFRVFKSTMHLFETTFDLVGFQHPPKEQIERYVHDFFPRLVEKYETDKALIPKGNLVEIPYDTLSGDALRTLASAYESLSLPGWDAAKPHIAAYLDSQAGYEKNVFRMDRATVERIEANWGAELQRHAYERPALSD